MWKKIELQYYGGWFSQPGWFRTPWFGTMKMNWRWVVKNFEWRRET